MCAFRIFPVKVLVMCFTLVSIHAAYLPTQTPRKRSIGDKWFDGCNWCVCTDGGVKCTEGKCSDSPGELKCENVGEKWWDGCYRCRCSASGIECKADQRCVQNPVVCRPRNGCVCGVDGVPSCTGEERTTVSFSESSSGKEVDLFATRPDSQYEQKEVFLPTKTECVMGRRWYKGSTRCQCDSEGLTTCGNPKWIAHRVDGFRLKHILCPSRLVWDHKCRRCTCHVSGIAFCVRIHHCHRRKNLQVDVVLKTKNECQIGSTWKEKCKTCYCSDKAKVVCDNRECNDSNTGKSSQVDIKTPTSYDNNKDSNTARTSYIPIQIPPKREGLMERRKYPDLASKPKLCAGKYKPGQRYWDECNKCLCTNTGDAMCTAMFCR